tara:strand:- start:292 stop:573 length:282 start_codon:yes stop_codon:yes gene_type:complete
MSEAEFNKEVSDVARTARNDSEAAQARDRMIRLREMGMGTKPPSEVVQDEKRGGKNPPSVMARGGKAKGYRYGTPKGGVRKKVKACRGRKANY